MVCPGAARGDVSGGGRHGVKDAMLRRDAQNQERRAIDPPLTWAARRAAVH